MAKSLDFVAVAGRAAGDTARDTARDTGKAVLSLLQFKKKKKTNGFFFSIEIIKQRACDLQTFSL